ncbi:hypothetical protein ACJJIF_20470 [Microbulbifer sp. SSSA002]|uniref:hypothetical protein n=1 Tax=Microbulbifer sp. SSSA002 TaxID=3243376 RepID=UPI004039FC88
MPHWKKLSNTAEQTVYLYATRPTHWQIDKQALANYLKRLDNDNPACIKNKIDQQTLKDKLAFIQKTLKG